MQRAFDTTLEGLLGDWRGPVLLAVSGGIDSMTMLYLVQSYMANVGGIGFDSHVCERVNRQKERGMRGKWIYLNALRYTMFHLKPIRISVQADGAAIYNGETYSLAMEVLRKLLNSPT